MPNIGMYFPESDWENRKIAKEAQIQKRTKHTKTNLITQYLRGL